MTLRFLQVVFDLDFEKLMSLYAKDPIVQTSSLLHEYGTPFFGLLNGIFLKKNKLFFGDYRGILIQLTPEPEPVSGLIHNHGIRGPFPGKFLYSNALLDMEELPAMPRDLTRIGERLLKIYDDGLAAVRGRYGVPDNFLGDFIADFRARGYSATFEGKKFSYPQYGIMARMTCECTPLTTRHYLHVRRNRSKKEGCVQIGAMDRAMAFGMSGLDRFDGKRFYLKVVSDKPYWPVVSSRTTVDLAEFDI